MSDVFAFVRRLYAGCGMESDMLELASLLNDLAAALKAGELDEATLNDYVSKICSAVVSHMQACGKSYDLGTCIDEVTKLVATAAAPGTFRALRMDLASRRQRKARGGGSGGASIL